MIGLSLTPLSRHSLAGWILAQIATLTGWLESSPHRWPPSRVAVALRAIHAGDEHWRNRAAEVGGVAMAKKQSRRTVSLGRQYHTKLMEYARAHHVSASQVTEYALDAQLAGPLDLVAFRTWAGERAVHAAEQGIATADRPIATPDPIAPTGGIGAAYRARRRRAEERERLEEERAARRATRQAIAGHHAERAAIRAVSNSRYLCSFCDQPGHAVRNCPNFIGPRQERPVSDGERAAMHRIDTGCTLQVAADLYGLTREAVRIQEKRLKGVADRPAAPVVIRQPTEEDRVDCSGLFGGVGAPVNPNCKSRLAARAVIEEGISQSEASRRFNVAYGAVNKYVMKLRAARSAVSP